MASELFDLPEEPKDRKRKRGSVIFSPYYKIQIWDKDNLTWRDVQKRYKSKEIATSNAPKDSKFRIMQVTMGGAHFPMNEKLYLFPKDAKSKVRKYSVFMTADVNDKGVLDIDTVKGCTAGMRARKDGGCYNACYAANIAKFRGIDFSVSVKRVAYSQRHRLEIEQAVKNAPQGFFRIGTMGDPCHEWEHTVETVEWLSKFARPVIITKHWLRATDEQLQRLIKCETVVNVSISALDTESELRHRVKELNRYKDFGGASIARIVSCNFNREHPEGLRLGLIQDELFKLHPTLDNPLRADKNHSLVKDGIIILIKMKDLSSERTISLENPSAYIGHCEGCTELCGISSYETEKVYNIDFSHLSLFEND